LYLKDGKLSLRSLNIGAAVDGSTPNNCLYLFIFRARLTLPWRFASNPAYERPTERISTPVKFEPHYRSQAGVEAHVDSSDSSRLAQFLVVDDDLDEEEVSFLKLDEVYTSAPGMHC
jgi:hypothetical protein